MSETSSTADATTETEAKKPEIYTFRCRVGHAIQMAENTLRVGIVVRDAEDKPTAGFQTNNLCPACVVNLLNSLAETFPVPTPVQPTVQA